MPGFAFTLRQIEVFEALRESRSFRLASEQLGVSQAAVSNHLKALETQLGVALFARDPGKRPTLTAQGLAFARDLEPFLAAARALNAHRRRSDEIEPYRFKIYVGLSLLEDYVRPKLDLFLGAHPELDLAFEAEPPGPAVLRKILEDRFDFALLHLTPRMRLDAPARLLARCRSGVFAHRSLLPGGGARPLSAAEVSRLPFVLPGTGTPQEERTLEALHVAGIRPTEIVRRTQYFDVLSALVTQGVGASLIGEAFIRPELRDEVVLVWPFDPWRMVLRRSPRLDGRAADAVEAFLVGSVLDDGRYPALAEPALALAPASARGEL